MVCADESTELRLHSFFFINIFSKLKMKLKYLAGDRNYDRKLFIILTTGILPRARPI